MDLIGAQKAAIKLMSTPGMASSAPFITQKSDWKVQINGAYNLLFPYIHTDFPVRLEVIEYVVSRILDALDKHNTINLHNGAYSSKGNPSPVIPAQINKWQLDKPYIKQYFNKNGLSSFNLNVKLPNQPSDALFATIGYGV